jgi:glycopeptide antibiotics resistance protein
VRLLFLAWLLLVMAVSLGPLKLKVTLRTVGTLHNAIHVAVFILTAVVGLLTPKTSLSRSSRICLLVLFCFLLELIQAFLYHNRYEWRDLYFDSLGLCFGWIAMILYRCLAAAKV